MKSIGERVLAGEKISLWTCVRAAIGDELLWLALLVIPHDERWFYLGSAAILFWKPSEGEPHKKASKAVQAMKIPLSWRPRSSV